MGGAVVDVQNPKTFDPNANPSKIVVISQN